MDKFNKAGEWFVSLGTYSLTGFGAYFNWGNIKGDLLFMIGAIIGVFQIIYWYKKSKGLLK